MLLVRQTSRDEGSVGNQHAENQESQEFDWDLDEVEGQPYLPSPWEIERCCREIRAGWSEAEYRKRAGQRVGPLEIAITPCRVSLYDLGVLDYS